MSIGYQNKHANQNSNDQNTCEFRNWWGRGGGGVFIGYKTLAEGQSLIGFEF